MRILYFLLTSCSLYGEASLHSLIESAQQNEKIQSLSHQLNAVELGNQSSKYSYLPKIDAFGSASYVDNTGGFDAKQSYSGGVKGEFVVFDGFKRENLFDQNKAMSNASKYHLYAAKKEISLDVIQRYYELQNTLDEIKTQKLLREQLEAQLVRLEKFKLVGLASEDALMRMQSEVSNAHYRIENLSYQGEKQKSNLETMVNQPISELGSFEVSPPKETQSQELDKLSALKHTRDAKMYEAHMQDSQNLPTIKLEDQYIFNDYVDDPIPQMRIDKQNKFTASIRMNLVDFSSSSLSKQSLMAQAQAQSSELAYAAKEAKHNRYLAERYIERSRVLIDASMKTHESSLKTFEAVKKKYEARIVDYVTYLDALHSLADSIDQLGRAKRNLNYAHAAYYYYSGLDPKEFIQ